MRQLRRTPVTRPRGDARATAASAASRGRGLSDSRNGSSLKGAGPDERWYLTTDLHLASLHQ